MKTSIFTLFLLTPIFDIMSLTKTSQNCQQCCKSKPKMLGDIKANTETNNTTGLYNMLNTAPCPPVWNIDLTLSYFTKTNMSCNEKIYILKNCLNSYNTYVTCLQKVQLLKLCLVKSLCENIYRILTDACSKCSEHCAESSSSIQHSKLPDLNDDGVDDEEYESSGEEIRTVSTGTGYIITDMTTPNMDLNTELKSKLSSAGTSCNRICLWIVLPILTSLILGVLISIYCVCRQERKRHFKKTSQVIVNDNNVIQLQKIRPYSYQEHILDPKVHVTINRSRSADWAEEQRTRLYRQKIANHTDSFKII